MVGPSIVMPSKTASAPAVSAASFMPLTSIRVTTAERGLRSGRSLVGLMVERASCEVDLAVGLIVGSTGQ